MSYTYHFYAIRPRRGAEDHASGLYASKNRIASTEDYQALRRYVAEHMNVPVQDIVVCSLTLLDEPAQPSNP